MSRSPMRMVPAASLSLVVQVTGGVLSALTNLYLAKTLGPSGKGIAQVLVTVPAILVVASNLGIHTASSWLLSSGRYTLSQVLSAALWWALAISAILAGPFWFLRGWLSTRLLGGAPVELLTLSLACVPFYLVAYYAADVLMASGRLVMYAVLRLLPLVVYGAVAIVLVGQYDMSVLGATIAFVSGIVASGIFALGAVVTLSRDWLKPDLKVMRNALGFGGPVHLGALAQFLVFRVDVLFVNALQGSAAAGMYSVASSIAEVVWYAGRSVESVIVPRIARADFEEARQITAAAIRVTAVASTMLALGVAVIAQPLVTMLLPAFKPALPTVWLLLPGAVLSGAFLVAAGDLRGRGRPGTAAAINVAGLVLTIFLLLVLVPSLGFIGAAFASVVTYALQLAMALVVLAAVSHVDYSTMIRPSLADVKLLRMVRK